jgi:hypothetical protein
MTERMYQSVFAADEPADLIRIINFAHPINDAQLEQITSLTSKTISRMQVIDIPAQINWERPLAEQALELLQSVPLSPYDWQTKQIIINPPGLAPLASTLLAVIHGIMGHFPALLVVRPVHDTAVPQFEVAGVLNLQYLRDNVRPQRNA